MRAVSPAFHTAAATGHRMVSRCEVYDYQGNILQTLTPVGGRVEVDEAAPVQRSFTAQFTTPLEPEAGELTFNQLATLLNPRAGNEVKVYRGVHRDSLGADRDELVPLGLFVIAQRRVRLAGDEIMISVSGYDRAWKVQRAKFTDAYFVQGSLAGQIENVIANILQRQAPWLPRNLMPTGAATPTGRWDFNSGDDPWAACLKFANMAGRELYIDVNGVALLEDRESRLGRYPTFAFKDGVNLVSLEVADDVESTWNYVKVVGEQSFNGANDTGISTPSAVAQDTNSVSSTRVDGPLRLMPRIVTSKNVTTVSQATLAARILLQWATGWDIEIDCTGLVNPALEAGDRIHVRYSPLDTEGIFTLGQFTVPLTADELMSWSGKKRVT